MSMAVIFHPQMALNVLTNHFVNFWWRINIINMSASSERNPSSFSGVDDQGPLSEMGDGDSDDGEDIFICNVSDNET